MQKITIYSDPGHAWAAVKIAQLEKLGIADKISAYSYMRGQSAYLEEDCDLSVYLQALKDKGIEYSFIEKHTEKRHPIRSYASYKKPINPVEFMKNTFQIVHIFQ
ncbi:hypothetical protein EBX93_16520 [bacterium]|nr:hypothetical protein [bacterium]